MDGSTQRFGFDVLTAPIAEVDRRGLSQAWYSALHLARDVQPTTPLGSVPTTKPTLATVHHLRANTAGGLRPTGSTPLSRIRAARAGCAGGEAQIERRPPRNSLAREIERAFSQSPRPARHASFVLDDLRGRVHVTIRTDGSSARLIAVCAPHARALVARALDDARYALAKRAIHVEARLKEYAR